LPHDDAIGAECNEGNSVMKKIATAGIGIAAAALVLVGCSNDKAATPASSTAAAGGSSSTQVSTGGSSEVKVEGQDLSGLDLKSVTCVKAGGKINVASGAVGGQQGVAVVMTDATPPTVDSLGLVVDGNALAVAQMGGMKTGSADVAVDGSTYTITGEAQGADMKNPMAGMISKKFEIKVTCN
jgi:lipoprotein LpqH